MTSPASTTRRPRSGSEYHHLDRRRLADALPPPPPAVFTFDLPPDGGGASRDASPARHSPYVNVPSLNYAEIRVGGGDGGAPSRPPTTPTQLADPIEYTVIDMVATAAAARVAREHAQLRVDSLRDATPPPATRRQHRRGGSTRDKKLSLTNLIGVNARKKATL